MERLAKIESDLTSREIQIADQTRHQTRSRHHFSILTQVQQLNVDGSISTEKDKISELLKEFEKSHQTSVKELQKMIEERTEKNERLRTQANEFNRKLQEASTELDSVNASCSDIILKVRFIRFYFKNDKKKKSQILQKHYINHIHLHIIKYTI